MIRNCFSPCTHAQEYSVSIGEERPCQQTELSQIHYYWGLRSGITSFAASVDDSRPVLAGVLLMLDEQTLAMAATDGFRLAVRKTELPARVGKKQVIVPAAALKELARILGSTKCARVTLYMSPSGAQVVLRCENVQLVLQLIDGRFPDYQVIVPKSNKTRSVVARSELWKPASRRVSWPWRAATWFAFS